jgi:hypothetical protein
MEEQEIALYERNAAFVSYGYYVASKVDGRNYELRG